MIDDSFFLIPDPVKWLCPVSGLNRDTAIERRHSFAGDKRKPFAFTRSVHAVGVVDKRCLFLQALEIPRLLITVNQVCCTVK